MNILNRFECITSLRFLAADVKLYVFVKKEADIRNLVKFLDFTYHHSYEILEDSESIPTNTQIVSSLSLREYGGFCSYLYSLDPSVQINTLCMEIETLLHNKEYKLLLKFLSTLEFNKLSEYSRYLYV